MTPINLPGWLSFLPTILNNGGTIVAAIVLVLGSLSGICTTLSIMLKALATMSAGFAPKASAFLSTAADHLGVYGIDLSGASDHVTSMWNMIKGLFGAGRPKPRDGQAGFTRVMPLLIVLACSGCAAAIAAIVPAAALVSCGILVDVDNPGLTFAQYCTKVIATCGGDLETLFAALISSKDPRLAGRAAEAKEAQADPAKMAALRGFVAAHRAEYSHPAAP